MTELKKKILSAFLIAIACAAVFAALFAFNVSSSAYASEAGVLSATEQTGLGLAVNVVTAQKANDFTTGHSVLTPSEIPHMAGGKITLNENRSSTYSTSDIEELMADFNLKFGLGAEAGTFLASLKSNLNLAGNFSYQDYSYKHFSLLEHKISRYRLYLENYLSPSTYENCYSSEYLSDLNDLKTSKNFNAFFEKYGTHIVGSAIYGGKLYATYSLVSDKFIINSDVESAIGASVSFSNLSSDTYAVVAQKLNSARGTNFANSYLRYGFYVNAAGGNAFASGLIDNFKSGYNSWANSFNTSDSNSVIIDYNEGGLVPLWDILPSQFSSLSSEMENGFKKYYQSNANKIVQEFKTANYKEFRGGSGTASDPFLIGNQKHLKNIENVSMNAHYKITNSFYLTDANWKPIGGYYKEKQFNGTLDGGGFVILDLSRTGDIAEINDRFYFGLFGCIGKSGTVKNLTLMNCDIRMDGPEVNNANARVFIGALAGAVYGTVDNVKVSGTCSYDICTNGMSYVGAIAGVAYDAKISNCVNKADITSGRYGSAAGGIVGYSTGATITGCQNYGKITAKGTAWFGHSSAGGIAGEKYDAKQNPALITYIENCVNYGELKATNYGNGPLCTSITDEICKVEQGYVFD